MVSRTTFKRRVGLASSCLLVLMATLSPALRLGRLAAIRRPRFGVATKRKYRVLDHDDESARQRLQMPFLEKVPSRTIFKEELAKMTLDHSQVLLDQPPVIKKKSNKKESRVITNVQELRNAILDQGLELKQVENQAQEADIKVKDLLNHQVIQLISKRFQEQSIPGHRNDNDRLALAIEGGGMRGAVSAGMAAAVASLGLCNTFDAIYGASAGSVIGAYMVSRQMCVDVYTEVLPAARQQFVCKKRLVKSIAMSAMDLMLNRKYSNINPGMNISFVLDGIMDQQHGLRPLDFETFFTNDAKQPLRVASSAVANGKLETLCFGSHDFNQTNGFRAGLFSCLEASMTVPGATGPPVSVLHNDTLKACFDAFCFEPIPYRSAVQEGATHVLCLRSRPEGFVAKTKPGVYEKAVTPLYFKTHGEPKVAEFFEKGGQQYIYLEDLLTLEEGRNAGITNSHQGIHVPPPDLLYGVDPDNSVKSVASNRKSWKKAHILPILVPKGTPELSTLEQGKDEVLGAVRGGFAAAFDLLAPAIGMDLSSDMNGERVAELMFPNVNVTFEEILQTPLSVQGHPILVHEEEEKETTVKPRRRKKKLAGVVRFAQRGTMRVKSLFSKNKRADEDTVGSISRAGGGLVAEDPLFLQTKRCHRRDAKTLLKELPGVRQIPHLAQGLHYTKEQM